jgi:hypothetical protein
MKKTVKIFTFVVVIFVLLAGLLTIEPVFDLAASGWVFAFGF